MKKLTQMSLIASALLALSASAYAANPLMATSCKLGENCHAPGAGKLVYFPVTQANGNNYACKLWADKDDQKVGASFQSGKDFHFTSQEASTVGTQGTIINISGNFSGQEGQIKIFGLNDNDGWVSCINK